MLPARAARAMGPARGHAARSARPPVRDPDLRGGAVITCPKCFKENQDHYKFCLGCGAELPRDASPKKFAPGTPPQGVAAKQVAAAPAPVAAPAAAPAPAPARSLEDEVTSVGTGGPGFGALIAAP